MRFDDPNTEEYFIVLDKSQKYVTNIQANHNKEFVDKLNGIITKIYNKYVVNGKVDKTLCQTFNKLAGEVVI